MSGDFGYGGGGGDCGSGGGRAGGCEAEVVVVVVVGTWLYLTEYTAGVSQPSFRRPSRPASLTRHSFVFAFWFSSQPRTITIHVGHLLLPRA